MPLCYTLLPGQWQMQPQTPQHWVVGINTVGGRISLHNACSVWETDVTGWSWVLEMQLRDCDTALTIN